MEQRTQAVDRIIKQMADMQVIYRDMSNMVLEQGTVLDRIEENVFEARYQAHGGVKELKKTVENESSMRAKACIGCLVQGIVICVVLIAFKFY